MTSRRLLLLGAAAAAGTASWPSFADDKYPSGTVRIVLPYAAGGAVDPPIRAVADKLTKQFGEAFIVDNRPGAGGRIGTEVVLRSPPNGQTLLGAASGIAINPLLYPKGAYDLDKDFTPIGVISRIPMVLVASPKLGVKSLADVVKLARDKPHSLNYGISGIGTMDHLVIERIKTQLKLDIVRIDYVGVPAALNAALAGDIGVMVVALTAGLQLIRAGKVVALAITSTARAPQLPGVPTMAESGVPNFVMYGWSALFAPSAAPPRVVQRLHDEVAKAVAEPDVTRLIVDNGGETAEMSLPELRNYVRSDQALFAEIIRSADIHVE